MNFIRKSIEFLIKLSDYFIIVLYYNSVVLDIWKRR